MLDCAVADLYARIAGRDDASGVFNANDEGDERVNDIVAAIGPYMPHKPDVRHVPLEEARAKMGPYADALALDQVIRSTRQPNLSTQKKGILAFLAGGSYERRNRRVKFNSFRAAEGVTGV